MTPLSDNTKGALLMIASMAAFTFGDACVKGLGGVLPLSQILTLRGIVASLFIAGLAIALGHVRFDFPRSDWRLIALRSLAELGAAITFFYALFNMKLANVTALLQMLPLTVTLGSALFFREPVGWRRWLAIGIGFCGMLLIVRPGSEGFNAFTLSALGTVVCVTVRDLVTRRMSRAVPSLLVTLCASLTVVVFAATWSLWQDWQPLESRSALLLGGASLFIIGGYTFSVLVMRVGEVGFVAPFRFTGLVWALLLGWLFFAEWPETLTLVGAVTIVATGFFTLWRETRAKRRQAKT
ncbi:DMT family transporter [Thalassococcus sp. CAU 1522]|uniref:DMT family transporter n=1 Tax=Thalassococcus arenae TaxID=2851652 RepID=A0ABS6N736_9RHOB|nr:DMT family transporter [Thalassococcus arenae]MBV2359831.1 DMT family transporter [Thalassococcus arenae]